VSQFDGEFEGGGVLPLMVSTGIRHKIRDNMLATAALHAEASGVYLMLAEVQPDGRARSMCREYAQTLQHMALMATAWADSASDENAFIPDEQEPLPEGWAS
jgi:hypothetical protein